jgi:hypothetical protein
LQPVPGMIVMVEEAEFRSLPLGRAKGYAKRCLSVAARGTHWHSMPNHASESRADIIGGVGTGPTSQPTEAGKLDGERRGHR